MTREADETTASQEASATTDSQPDAEPTPPALKIVKGDATPEEVAAVVTVLGAAGAASAASARRPASTWSAPARRVRRTLPHGAGGWRASGLPR